MTLFGASEERPLRIAFFLPHLSAGGIERVVVNVLRNINRTYFFPTLILREKRGSLLSELPISVPVIDLGGTKSRWVVPALCACLAKNSFDVVYSGTNAANISLLAASRLMRCPPKVIVSEHTSAQLYLREAKWRLLRLNTMRMLYPESDLVVTPVAELGEELRATLKKPDLPVREILNPLFDESQVVERESRSPPNGAPNASPYFVAAGRLSKVKGYDLLIKAFAELLKHYPDMHLRLLGDGEERDSLQQLARDLRVDHHVHFHGFVEQPIDFFRSAKALVVSSHREGTPNVIPEAMSVGLPVVARDCSVGVRRLLRNGGSGVLVRGGEPDELAEGMLSVLNSPRQREHLVAAGYAQARKFSFERALPRFEQAFLDVYNDGIARGGPIASLL